MHLIIEKEVATYKILQEGKPFILEGSDFRREKISTKHMWNQQPSEVSNIPFDVPLDRDVDLGIYTDGSESEHGLGHRLWCSTRLELNLRPEK